MTAAVYPFQRPPKPCSGCGQALRGHPAHHRLCRTCHGYTQFRRVLDTALADIRAVQP